MSARMEVSSLVYSLNTGLLRWRTSTIDSLEHTRAPSLLSVAHVVVVDCGFPFGLPSARAHTWYAAVSLTSHGTNTPAPAVPSGSVRFVLHGSPKTAPFDGLTSVLVQSCAASNPLPSHTTKSSLAPR